MEGFNPTTSVFPVIGGLFYDPAYSAELQELQAPLLGRKCAIKDRRPIDPPPIVKLRIFRTYYDNVLGAFAKVEVDNYAPHTIVGCVCHCDLLRISPPQDHQLPSQTIHQSRAQHTHRTDLSNDMIDNMPSLRSNVSGAPVTSSAPWVTQHPVITGHVVNPLYAQEPTNDVSWTSIPTYMATSELDPAVTGAEPVYPGSSNQRLLPAEVNCTTDLFGNRVVQARNVKHEEKDALMFVFGDLAVQQVGYFRLRYRFFDIFTPMPSRVSGSPILAQCYGSPFRVYDSKEFPGLPPSTSLSHLVAKQGISVRTRQHQRKGKSSRSSYP